MGERRCLFSSKDVFSLNILRKKLQEKNQENPLFSLVIEGKIRVFLGFFLEFFSLHMGLCTSLALAFLCSFQGTFPEGAHVFAFGWFVFWNIYIHNRHIGGNQKTTCLPFEDQDKENNQTFQTWKIDIWYMHHTLTSTTTVQIFTQCTTALENNHSPNLYSMYNISGKRTSSPAVYRPTKKSGPRSSEALVGGIVKSWAQASTTSTLCSAPRTSSRQLAWQLKISTSDNIENFVLAVLVHQTKGSHLPTLKFGQSETVALKKLPFSASEAWGPKWHQFNR